MSPLSGRWQIFLKTVGDPWVVVLILVDCFLGWVLTLQDDPVVVPSLTLVVSLISGIIGAILEIWPETTFLRGPDAG